MREPGNNNAKSILKKMFEAGAKSSDKFPTPHQINTKKQFLKRTLNFYEEHETKDEPVDTFDLVDLIPKKDLIEQDFKECNSETVNEMKEDEGFSEAEDHIPDIKNVEKASTEGEKEEVYSSINAELSTEPKARGPEIDWLEEADYESVKDFEASNHKKEIMAFMSARKSSDDRYCQKSGYSCKFGRKRGFKMCPRQLKVCFLNETLGGRVTVWSNRMDHLHEANSDNLKTYLWTDEQLAIIKKYMVIPMRSNTIQILKKMKMVRAISRGKYPTLMQINNKKALLTKLKKPGQAYSGKRRQGRPSKKRLTEVGSSIGMSWELEETVKPKDVKTAETWSFEAKPETIKSEEADPENGETEEIVPGEAEAEEADPIEAEADEAEAIVHESSPGEASEPAGHVALCSPCGDGSSAALYHCTTCEEHFCAGCNATHGRLRVARGHLVVVASPCTPCMEQGREVEAVAHCRECRDFHCPPCSSQHGRFRATREHVLTLLTPSQPLHMSPASNK